MMEFLKMGGYAAYIWTAYGISALVLTGLLVTSLRSHRAANILVWSLEEDRHVYLNTQPSDAQDVRPGEPAGGTAGM